MSTSFETTQHLVGFQDFQDLDEFNRYCDDIKTGKVQIIKLYGNGTNVASTIIIDKLIEAIRNSPRDRLNTFEIHNYPLGADRCIRLLRELENKRKLDKLRFVDCQIGNQGVKATLTFLKKNKSVSQAGLDKNELSISQVCQLCTEMGKSEIAEKYRAKEQAAAAAEQQSLIEAQTMLRGGQGQISNTVQALSNILALLGSGSMGFATQIRATQDAKLALDELIESIITDRNKTSDKENVAIPTEPDAKLDSFEGARDLTRISQAYLQCLHNGEELLKQEQYHHATQSFEQACDLASTNLQLADCHTKIGESYMMSTSEIGRSMKLAVDEFNKSLALQKKEGLEEQHPDRVKNESLIIQCRSYLNWKNASALDRRSDFANAKKLYILAADGFLSIGNVELAIVCYLNAAMSCCEPSIHDLNLATQLCQKAKDALQSEPQITVGPPLTSERKEELNSKCVKIETRIKSLLGNAAEQPQEPSKEKLNPLYEKCYSKGIAQANQREFQLAIDLFNKAMKYATTDEQRADCHSSSDACYLALSKLDIAENDVYTTSENFYNAAKECKNSHDLGNAYLLSIIAINTLISAYERENEKFAPNEYQQRWAVLHQLLRECSISRNAKPDSQILSPQAEFHSDASIDDDFETGVMFSQDGRLFGSSSSDIHHRRLSDAITHSSDDEDYFGASSSHRRNRRHS